MPQRDHQFDSARPAHIISVCRSGGTGRRSRLKICRGNTRVGSIPSFGTIPMKAVSGDPLDNNSMVHYTHVISISNFWRQAMTEIRQETQHSSYDLNRLRIYNGLMGLLHLGQAIFIVVLGWGKGLTVPVTTSYLKAGGPGGMPAPTPATLGSFRLGPAIAIFLLLSAIAHFVTILPGVFEWYKANLQRGINYIRWYEYALSSSIFLIKNWRVSLMDSSTLG